MTLPPYLIVVVAVLGLLLQSTRFADPRRRLAGATLPDWLWRAARWLYGGWFLYAAALVVGILWFHVPPVPEPHGGAKAFSDALAATGFFYPLLMVDYALGGLALLFRRTAPLGLALLAPPVAVIFLFHLTLTGNVAWGGGWALGWALLAWRYRSGFAGLWTFRADDSLAW